MKASITISALTMAVVAIATPADPNAHYGKGAVPYKVPQSGGHHHSSGSKTTTTTTNTCSNSQKQICCNSIDCLVQILGSGCDGGSFCCETNAGAGAIVNLSLLNCIAL